MWKLLRVFGFCAALVGWATVRNACASNHPPLFPDFCELEAPVDWFEPIYCDCPEAPQVNEGIYFGYERVNWNILSAPRSAVGNRNLPLDKQIFSSTLITNVTGNGNTTPPAATAISNAIDVGQPDSNFGWGNRYEFGYIWDNAGWNVGVVEGFESIDSKTYGVANTTAGAQPFTGSVAVLFNIPAGLMQGFVDANGDGAIDDVDSDGLTIGTPTDFGDLVAFVPSFDTLRIDHRSTMNGVELMRTLRRDDFFATSTLEFMYGARFTRVDNEMRALGLGGFLADSNWASEVENKMVGPQVALRWTKSNRRWSLRAQGRFMAAANIRDASLVGTMASLHQPSLANNSLYLNPTSFAQYDSDVAFSPLAEGRLDAVFRVTQKFALTVGYTGTYASNMGYGSNMVDYRLPSLDLVQLSSLPTQHFFSNGLNFGFEVNR